MTSMDILTALEGLPEEFIRETDDRRRKGTGRQKAVRGWVAAAACLAVVLGVGTAWAVRSRQMGTPRPVEPPAAPTDPVEPGDTQETPDGDPEPPTSETYGSLEELLAYLSTHEEHDESDKRQGGADIPGETAETVTEGVRAVAWGGETFYGEGVPSGGAGGFACYVREGGLWTVPLEGGTAEPVETGFPVEQLFISGDVLAAVGVWRGRDLMELGQETDPEGPEGPWVKVRRFRLQEDGGLEPLGDYIQSGEPVALYLQGETLMVLTGDGECACGWSRLQDTSQYIPWALEGEREVSFTESTSILGEPGQVRYVACCGLHLPTGAPEGPRALYGDVIGVRYGAGWFEVSTQKRLSDKAGPEIAYFFDTGEGARVRGRADLSGLGESAEVRAIRRVNGRYQVLCDAMGDGNRAVLLAAALDGETLAVTGTDTYSGEGSLRLFDVLWQEDRAVLAVNEVQVRGYDVESFDHLVTLDISGETPVFADTGLITDEVSGVDGIVGYGSPLGYLESIIPLGGDVFMRFDGVPRGFDIVTLEGQPRFLCRSAGELPEGERFNFDWTLLGNHILLVEHLVPGPDGRIAVPAQDYRLYRVDPGAAEPITLLGEYPSGIPLTYGGRVFIISDQGPVEVELP